MTRLVSVEHSDSEGGLVGMTLDGERVKLGAPEVTSEAGRLTWDIFYRAVESKHAERGKEFYFQVTDEWGDENLGKGCSRINVAYNIYFRRD